MFAKGFSYGYDGRRGMYNDERAVLSLKRLASTGCNWVSLAFSIRQDTYHSRSFGFDYRFSIPDRELENIIKKQHAFGFKVCLKPMINCGDGVWRANISFPESEWGNVSFWDEWFGHYTAFMRHYAEIAELAGCEMLCIGCEMVGTERKTAHWRKLIEEVRKVYSGPLVYNANHGQEDNVKWFDEIEYIGTSAYYPITKPDGDKSIETMVKGWEKARDRLRELSERHGSKKIIFMEIGCRSATGCSSMPWDFKHRDLPFDENEQADFYESCFRVMWDEPWFAGYFWWDWYTFLPQNEQNTGFSIYNKKAENVVKEWYSKNRN